MTDTEHATRIEDVEREANTLAYLDDAECWLGDYEWHARLFMHHLSWCVDADYYGVARPEIATGCVRLDERIQLGLEQLDARWRNERWTPN